MRALFDGGPAAARLNRRRFPLGAWVPSGEGVCAGLISASGGEHQQMGSAVRLMAEEAAAALKSGQAAS